jgi:hypothetical protein
MGQQGIGRQSRHDARDGHSCPSVWPGRTVRTNTASTASPAAIMEDFGRLIAKAKEGRSSWPGQGHICIGVEYERGTETSRPSCAPGQSVSHQSLSWTGSVGASPVFGEVQPCQPSHSSGPDNYGSDHRQALGGLSTVFASRPSGGALSWSYLPIRTEDILTWE